MNLFDDFDFSVLDNPEFEESSVREEFIAPLLKALGYKSFGKHKIIREKKFTHPFVKTASQKRELTSYPDYLLEVDGTYRWVLDAKNPNENIESGPNREQAYFYAIHPEINVQFYALCNGRSFILYMIQKTAPIINFNLAELDKHWELLREFLSPDKLARQLEPQRQIHQLQAPPDYENLKPPKELKKVRKWRAKRHFGPHGYFTRQSWDVLQH